jgi:hypothetical protein
MPVTEARSTLGVMPGLVLGNFDEGLIAIA